jgi:hypothetical protein
MRVNRLPIPKAPLHHEPAVPHEQLAVGVDLAALAEVAHHVPVHAGSVDPAALGYALQHCDVDDVQLADALMLWLRLQRCAVYSICPVWPR